MKRIALFVVIATSFPSTLTAQESTAAAPASSVAQSGGSKLFDGITLSVEQIATMKAATADFSAEVARVTGSSDVRRRLTRSELAEVAVLRDRLTVRIRGVLTSDQRAVFEKNLAKSNARRRG